MKKQKVLEVLTIKDIRKINSCERISSFHKAIVNFLFNTGLRVSELVNLKMKEVLTSNGKIKDVIEVIGKGNKRRQVVLNQKARKNLNIIIQNTLTKREFDINLPIIVSNKAFKMSRQQLHNIIKKIQEIMQFFINIHCHTLRHSFATYLMQLGTSIKIIQDLLGHSDIKTTCKFYLHTTINDLKKAVYQL